MCVIWFSMATAMPFWPPVAFSPTLSNFFGGHSIGGQIQTSLGTYPQILSSIHRKAVAPCIRGPLIPLQAADESPEAVDAYPNDPQCRPSSSVPAQLLDSFSGLNLNSNEGAKLDLRGNHHGINGGDPLPEYDEVISGMLAFEKNKAYSTLT